MKLNRVVTAILLLVIGATLLVAQEIAPESFVRQLTSRLSEFGWGDEAVAHFRQAADEMDWSGAEHADPMMLAWALEFGMPEDATAIQERARIALQLATHTAEMARVGYSRQDIAYAAQQAARTVAQSLAAAREEEGDPERRETGNVGEMIRMRLGDAIDQQVRTATRVRSGDAAGSTYRIGESDPGVPLNPEDPPRPGDPGSGNPNGPGDGTSDPQGPRN